MISSQYELTIDDVEKWVRNSLIFLAPALIVFLTAIQAGTPFDEAIKIMYLYGLNVAIDLLKKFVNENKYE
jgi:hypothetical protein